MGSGRGFIHTTSSARVHSIGNGGGGLASAPVATMGSVNGRGVSSSTVASISCAYGIASTPRVRSGIYTAASAISGGVTTEETGHHHGSVRRGGTPEHPGEPEDPCPHCVDEDGDGICDICDEEMESCSCEECHCPLDEEWHVWLFVSLIAAIYALCKRRASHRTVMSVMVARCSRD